MMEKLHTNDPLHGITLQAILEILVAKYGFEYLSQSINIKCFTNNPTIKSSLSFLRKTPWARARVEALYVGMINNINATK